MQLHATDSFDSLMLWFLFNPHTPIDLSGESTEAEIEFWKRHAVDDFNWVCPLELEDVHNNELDLSRGFYIQGTEVVYIP